MSLVNTDLPEDAQKQMRAAAAALPPDDTSPPAQMLRASVLSHAEWVKADRIRTFIAHQWRQLFREFDVVVCPIMPVPAFPHDHGDMNSRKLSIDGQDIPYAAQAAWSSVATLTGLPATAIPIGLSGDGLPIGVQIVGPYLEDLTTIDFAGLAEREFGGFVAPPAFRN